MKYSVYEKFTESLRESKIKAVQAFYEAGYITEEEAKTLMAQDFVQRNECTTVFINEHTDEVVLTCWEKELLESTETTTILFHLSYNKDSDVIIDYSTK